MLPPKIWGSRELNQKSPATKKRSWIRKSSIISPKRLKMAWTIPFCPFLRSLSPVSLTVGLSIKSPSFDEFLLSLYDSKFKNENQYGAESGNKKAPRERRFSLLLFINHLIFYLVLFSNQSFHLKPDLKQQRRRLMVH